MLTVLKGCFDTLFNPFTPEGFSIDKQNHLALDRVKSVSISGVKG